MVGRLDGKLVGSKVGVADGRAGWDGVEEGWLACKLVSSQNTVGASDSEGIKDGLDDP